MNTIKTGIFSVFLLALFTRPVLAASLTSSLSQRDGFSVSSVDSTSYDRPAFNAFKPFNSVTSSELFSVNSFTGGAAGGKIEFFLLSEAGFYDGHHIDGVANQFGLIDSKGNFHSVIDSRSKDPGFSTEVFQGADEKFTLALLSPEGLFSSIDSDNKDSAAHILARRVDKDGEVKINRPDLKGLNGPLSFNLLAGDLILCMEDLLSLGNLLHHGIPGDFDYNDMVVVARYSSEVPEPATLTLFGMGALGASIIRRRRVA